MTEFEAVIAEIKKFLLQDPPPEQGKVAYFLSVDDAKAILYGVQQLLDRQTK